LLWRRYPVRSLLLGLRLVDARHILIICLDRGAFWMRHASIDGGIRSAEAKRALVFIDKTPKNLIPTNATDALFAFKKRKAFCRCERLSLGGPDVLTLH
jgi:hypothetical protein